MRRLFTRFAVSTLLASLAFSTVSLCGAQTAAAVKSSARVLGAVDPGQTVRLSGHVPAFADTTRLPSTAMDPKASFAHLTMVLSRSPAVEAAFEQLLADQVNPSSPRYHQWLTPEQVGTLYGPAQSDVDAVSSWLQSQGLTVNSVSPNRLYVDFGGPAVSVEKAFGTSFRLFSLANGEQRYSLVQEPTVPAAIQPVVATVAGLSEVIHHSTAHKGELVTPKSASGGGERPALNGSSGNHYLVSGDFAVAYDINPVYNSNISGAGQSIAVAGEARVAATDISSLEAIEGVASKQPNVIVPPTGADPGAAATTSGADNLAQDEATLDVDRTISTAPGAGVDLVVSGNVGSGNTYATSGLYIAINYAISTLNDPILSLSFGGCESLNGQANDTYEASIFQTAVSQGITTFVSSGDSGAAACNAFYATIPSTQVLSINDFCANQYVTCVGGTEFADTANPSAYWSATNGTNYVTLLSYIPEGAWNDVSVSNTGVYSQGATGGGTSIYLPRPTWQTGPTIPAGTDRLIPDISLTSSTHDGFVTCLAYQGATCGSFYSFGGTSAAAPSMAGIQALVNQKLGGRQGNINPTIYSLGNSTSAPYNDVTVASSGVASCAVTTPSLCNNSTPASSSLTGGLAGYQVTASWDETTGWGSVDVAKYLTAVASGFTITPASTSLSANSGTGSTVTDNITITSTSSFAGTAALACSVATASGTAAGTCSLSPTSATLAAGGSGTSTLTVSPTAGTSGTLSVTVSGVSGSTTETSSTITVTVSAPSFTITPASTGLNLISNGGATVTDSLAVASLNGYVGTVTLTCSVVATGNATGSCAVAPTSATLLSGGTGASTLTVTNTSQGGVGSLKVTVTGTSGTLTTSTTVTVAVSGPTFSLTPAATSLTTATGQSQTDAITVASVNTFAGPVALSCVTSSPAAGTCSVSPASATLTSGSSTTSTLAVTTVTGFSGSYTVTLTGTSGTITQTVTIPVTVAAPSFTLSTNPASLNFTSGATSGNTSTLSLQSTNSFAGSVALSCSLTSSTAHFQPTCAITGTPATLAANGTSTASLTISSTTAVSAAERGGLATASRGWSLGGGAALALLLFCAPLRKRRRAFGAVVTMGLLALGLGAMSGCSNNSGSSVPVMQSSAGNYTATITATGTTMGASTAATTTATVAVTIN